MELDFRPASFGLAALTATDLIFNKGMRPVEAWCAAASSVFPDSVTNQKKGCPKSAFLGILEDGYVFGVPAGKYTNSIQNKRYAIDAIHLLQSNSALADNPAELWRNVVKGSAKRHNGQMNVVIALWKANKLTCQSV